LGKLIVSMMTSLDGFIEGPNRELDWSGESADFNAYCDDMLNHTDTMLFGRVSYEMMIKYWPAAETKPKDEWERGFARRMNSLPKLVLSKTLDRAEWKNARVLKSDVKEEVQALKQRAQKDCFVFGGARVISSLRRMGLVDEYRVLVHPIVLGRGTPLFVDVEAPLKLQALRSQRFDSGVEVLHYGPA
jgi:dihydrofolate reductase